MSEKDWEIVSRFSKPKPNHNPNPNPNSKPNPENKNGKKLRKKEKEKGEPSVFELQNSPYPEFALSKRIHEGPGFRIPDSGSQLLDSGFQPLDSGFQPSGFRIPYQSGFRIPNHCGFRKNLLDFGFRTLLHGVTE